MLKSIAQDIISLSVQGLGRTAASIAVGRNQSLEHGAHIMLGGVIFQMVTISIYILLASEFSLRYFTNRPLDAKDVAYHSLNSSNTRCGHGQLNRPLRIMIGALAFNNACLLIRGIWDRAIYPTLELLDGFEGRIISTERFFNVLDGGMIMLAILALNVAHPGMCLAPQDKASSDIELKLQKAGLLYYRL
ncbi:RTA-like protein [Mycena sp. CBHHK59/15]|nr:RTA-like protein [Mycena sp. CBHHK59/15]